MASQLLVIVMVTQLTKTLSGFTVIECPGQCSCSADYLTINCQKRHLTTLPETIPAIVQSLTLDDNFLDSLPDGAFSKFTILKHLSLRRNRLRHLSDNVFSGLINLQELDLSENNLDYTENLIIEKKSLGRLTRLDLSRNKQTDLPIILISRLPSLQILNVSYNQITNVRLTHAFKHTPQLRTIDISGNKLLWLRDSPFHVASTWSAQLSTDGVSLNLSDCNIMSIGANTFNDFHRLRSLTLSGNHVIEMAELRLAIKSLEPTNIIELYMSQMGLQEVTCFSEAQLLNLQVLDLSYNNIKIVAHAFTYLVKLRMLNMRNNRLRTLDGIINMADLQYLFLPYNQITELSTESNVNLTKLEEVDLSCNRISDLSGNLLSNANELHTLNLAANQVTNIEPLNALGKLRFLSLRRNRITDLSTLKTMTSLTYFDASQNHVTRVTRRTLSRDLRLMYLNMSENLISEIEPDSLSKLSPKIVDFSHNRLSEWSNTGLTGTVRLYLHSNQISNITDDAFTSMTSSLTLLDFHGNKLKELNNVLRGLTVLTFLDLSHNPLQYFWERKGQTKLASLQSLRVLSLQATGIQIVSGKMLERLTNLRQIDLSANRIIALSPSLFLHQRHLQFLNLSNNRIESVGRATFDNLPELELLDLSQNPLYCTCDLMKFIRWTFKSNITILSLGHDQLYRCVFPESWTEIPVSELHFHLDGCLEDGDRVVIFIAIGFLVVLVLLAVILTCYFVKCCIQSEPARRRDSYCDMDDEDGEEKLVQDTSWV